MTIKVGYWVDLQSVKFDETGGTWIQAMPLGTYQHPVYGEIKFDAERVSRFADNVNRGVRGQELDIDYDHKAHHGEAAGWVRQAQARTDGLWLLVEWTKSAAEKIKEKAYRYFSPEFVDEWTNPISNQTFQDVLFGGGITNRPFLKDILPINMSELLVEPQEKKQGGTGMDPKKLRELLGLPEGASDTDVESAIKKFKETPPTPQGGKDDDQLKQLAENNPTIKLLMEQQEQTRRELAETQAALRLSEIGSQVVKLNEGKKHQLPAVVLNELPAALVQMPKALSETVIGVLTKLTETGMVVTGEIGQASRGGNGDGSDPVKAFTDKIAEVMKSNDKLDYGSAVRHVSLTEPKLFADYRAASYAFREN